MSSIKHGRRIVSDKYYDGLVIGTIEEFESQRFTNQAYLLKDIIDALAVITGGQTKDLTIRIQLDKQDRYKLTQRWRVQ